MQARFIIAILLLTFFACEQPKFDASQISPETMVFVDQIVEVNVVMGSAVSSGGERPQQYDNFEALKSQANLEELTELTDHPNGVVRCYAFWALSFLDSVDLFSIIIDHIDDTARVETQFGCEVYYERVGDFFVNRVRPSDYKDNRQLSALEIEKLDSILLHEPNFLENKTNAISHAELMEENYPAFRRLVLEENDPYALLKLAKYQEESDIDLIMSYREKDNKEEEGYGYTYRAIAEFPHPRFLPFLKNNLINTMDNNHPESEWSALYNTIAIYQNETALALLQIPLTHVNNGAVRDDHIDYVFEALDENRAPIYNELLWFFWEEEHRISRSIREYLTAIDSSRAINIAAKLADE
jgi:hypothetical protein